MNVLPVISRELRVQARQPFTFRLRVVGVLALLAACAWFLVDKHSERNVGGQLFATLHGALFYTTLLLVTFSAADCLSRERREGTLGLLLLTPLCPTDIVIAKGLAQAARAFTLVLAVIPIFALPMLLGGVSGQQLTMSLLLIFSASCLALGAALIASAWCKQWLRALVTALLLAIFGWLWLTSCLGVLLYPALARGNSNFGYSTSLAFEWLLGVGIATGAVDPRLSRFVAPGFLSHLSTVLCQVAGLAFTWLLAAIWLAARHIRKVWREEPPSAQRQWVEAKFTTPVMGLRVYHCWMRSLLNRNPVGWLQRRTWQGRLVTWVWLAIVISVTTNALNYRNLLRNFSEMQHALAWLLVISVAATVAGSFRRERETGVLELLLISPLSVRRIVLGRLLGLWGQFLPAVAIFTLTWAYIAGLVGQHRGDFQSIGFFLCLFITLPVIGLYFSLRCQSFISALLLTLAFGMVLPQLTERLTAYYLDPNAYYSGRDRAGVFILGAIMTASVQTMLAVYLNWLTCRRLEKRQFNFERTTA